MLCAMKSRGWDFDEAWPNAIQRLRAQPYMSDAETQDLAEWKIVLGWAKPAFAAAYDDGPPVALNGVETGERLSHAQSGVMDHTGQLENVA